MNEYVFQIYSAQHYKAGTSTYEFHSEEIVEAVTGKLAMKSANKVVSKLEENDRGSYYQVRNLRKL
jgi:hypothetical protein